MVDVSDATEPELKPARVVVGEEESSAPVAEGTNRRHTWDEFREAGLLWWANRALHVFGWAIVVSTDDETGEYREAYPVRTEWRGFPRDREELGYRRVSKWMKRAAVALDDEAGRE